MEILLGNIIPCNHWFLQRVCVAWRENSMLICDIYLI